MTGADQPPLYREHWLDIEPQRFDRYKKMFQWSALTDALIAPAQIQPGQVVVDMGCGPGFTAIELAKRVGEGGHVHAVDINPEFVEHAGRLASDTGLAARVTVHRVDTHELPLPGESVDRVVAMNVMVYVDDPVASYREFRRVLKPGGIAHAVDSDWELALAEPVPGDLWRELMATVLPAFRTPTIGRQLLRCARTAGFSDVEVQVASRADTDGRLVPMVRGLCSRARKIGTMNPGRIDAIEKIMDEALAQGMLLILNPQFMVTAK